MVPKEAPPSLLGALFPSAHRLGVVRGILTATVPSSVGLGLAVRLVEQ